MTAYINAICMMMQSYDNSKILLNYINFQSLAVEVWMWERKSCHYFVWFCVLQAKVTLKNPSIRRIIDEAYSLAKKSKSYLQVVPVLWFFCQSDCEFISIYIITVSFCCATVFWKDTFVSKIVSNNMVYGQVSYKYRYKKMPLG